MEFKKIKELNQDDRAQFSKFFPTPSMNFVRVSKVPEILTHSKGLQEITVAVDMISGTIFGMGFEIYRNDLDDASKGFPINRDVYQISGSTLLKVLPPFENHWLTSVPSVPLMVF